MQVEIKSVMQNDHEYKGRITKRKLIETSEGSFNVTEKNKSYLYVPIGFQGIADIEFDEREGKKFIKIFKAGKGSITQTPQKPQETQKKAVNGAFKKDPAGIALETWKRRHTSWIGCLQCAVNHHRNCYEITKDETINYNDGVILTTNQFYDALCEKIDKKKEVKPKENEPKQETKAEPEEHPEVVESEDITDIPF